MSQKHTLQEYSVQESQNIQLGQGGYEYIQTSSLTPASTTVGHWIAYTILGSAAANTNVTITASSSHSPDGTQEYIVQAVPRGTTIYGSFKQIAVTRTSGTAALVAYKG